MRDVFDSGIELTTEVLEKIKRDGFSGLVTGVSAAVEYRIWNFLFFDRFEWWQRRGIHVLRVSRWSPVPDTSEIDRQLWTEESELDGIEVREDEQLRTLAAFRNKYGEEYAELPDLESEKTEPYQHYTRNGTFETVDGEILYCMVRENRPDRVLQIGGGFSTRALAAALDDGSIDCTVTVFEPYRDTWLNEDSRAEFTLAGRGATDIDVDRFERLERGDILFVDSFHVLRVGNDLYTLLFDGLPRLSEGVLVHFHDIFLPSEYPAEWVFERFSFLNEQYAVRAFLLFNDRFEVRWAGKYMHDTHPEALADAFESYDPSLAGSGAEMFAPNSLWLEVTEE